MGLKVERIFYQMCKPAAVYKKTTMHSCGFITLDLGYISATWPGLTTMTTNYQIILLKRFPEGGNEITR